MYDISDRRNAIRALQRYLLEIAYAHEGMPRPAIDGIYGDVTRAAVRFFQETYGLPITARVEYRDFMAIYRSYLRALANRLPNPTLLPPTRLPLATGDSGSEVHLLQTILAELSADYGGLGAVRATGNYDNDTAQAVRAYQTQRLLPPTSVTDLMTWQALTRDYTDIDRRRALA